MLVSIQKSNFLREFHLVNTHGKNSQQYNAFSAILLDYIHVVKTGVWNAEEMNSWLKQQLDAKNIILSVEQKYLCTCTCTC